MNGNTRTGLQLQEFSTAGIAPLALAIPAGRCVSAFQRESGLLSIWLAVLAGIESRPGEPEWRGHVSIDGLDLRCDREGWQSKAKVIGRVHTLDEGLQRLEALTGEVRVLLLDDPTANLMPADVHAFERRIGHLKGARGLALLWVTSSRAQRLGVSKRWLQLKAARLEALA